MGKVQISGLDFDSSMYSSDEGSWKASSLYAFAKGKEYPIVDLPLWAIDLTVQAFDSSSLYNFIFQCKRVSNCSLEHPIIINNKGHIVDGYHRICKAILDGETHIKAIRMQEMPAPDYPNNND